MKKYLFMVLTTLSLLLITGCNISGSNDNSSNSQNIKEAAFVNGMGCSDPTCTDLSHHHDCPTDCKDYSHHHNCSLDCEDENHNHSNDHHSHNSDSNHNNHH